MVFFAIAGKIHNSSIWSELDFELFNNTEKVSIIKLMIHLLKMIRFSKNLDDNEIGGDKSIESKEISESSEEFQNDILNAKADQIIHLQKLWCNQRLKQRYSR